MVVFWKMLKSEETAATGKGAPMLRYYNVFNLEQCEGIEAPDPGETVNNFDPIRETKSF